MFIRHETFSTFIRRYPVISIILAIHLLLFFWVNLSELTNGLIPFGEVVYYLMVGNNFAIQSGEYWRLLTPVFLHTSFGHVLFNSFALLLFGPPLEFMLGRLKFLTFYLTAGIIGNIATLFFGSLYLSHLGASGAIYGLFGAYVFIMMNRRHLIDPSSAQIVVVLLVIGMIFTLLNSGVNIWAHVFGFVAGFGLIPLFLKNVVPFYFSQGFGSSSDIRRPRRKVRAVTAQKAGRKIALIAAYVIVGAVLLRVIQLVIAALM